MLKSFIILLATLIILGCSAKPQETGFSGTGEFDANEAAKTRVSLGLTYLQNGNFSQAKFNLDKALEFAPKSGEANYAMAFYYEQVDELIRAENYFRNALSYSNNDPDILNSYGAFLCKQGRYDIAKENFLKAVDDKRYVATAETYENLALCSQSQGKLEEAIEYFNTALNHQPTRSSTLLYLTEIYVNEAQWDSAKRSLFKYERNANVNANSLWLSYQIAQGQQNIQAAQDYAALLLQLYPDHEYTKMANSTDAIWQPSKKITRKIKQREQKVEPQGKTQVLLQPNNNASIQNSREPESTVTIKSKQKSSTIELNQPIAESQKTSSMGQEESVKQSVENENSRDQAKVVIKSKVKPDIEKETTVKTVAKQKTEQKTTNESEFYHVVQPKENLFQISTKYNVKMAKLIEWNNLSDASSIQIGSRLWIRDPNTNE